MVERDAGGVLGTFVSLQLDCDSEQMINCVVTQSCNRYQVYIFRYHAVLQPR